MPDSLLPIEQILTTLAAGPQKIADVTEGLAPTHLHTAPGPGEWSANEVLAHLRSCGAVWGDCIATIINQDRPKLRALNPMTWLRRTDYLEQDFQPSLQAFTAQRIALVALLESLEPEAWSRSATVTGAGKTLERSVHLYAQRMAIHERPHLKQIARIASTMRP